MSDHLGYNELVLSFKSQAKELEDALSKATKGGALDAKSLDQLSLKIAKLRSVVAEAMIAGTLPTYDQRICEERVALLEDSLSKIRSSSKSKPKFSFKSSINARPADQFMAEPTSAVERSSATSNITPKNRNLMVSPSPTSATKITINDRNHQVLTFADATGLQSFTETNPEQSVVVTIGGLINCFVNLASAAPFTVNALHVQGLKRTVLYAGKVQGSVLLHDCFECTIIVSTHQFRMHTSSITNVYLEVSSNPVIEKCADIRFGPFPLTSGTEAATESSSKPDANGDRLPYIVQDFDWMGASQSPNWSSIGTPSFQLPINVPNDNLDDVLDRLLPHIMSS